jgi:hypothetical protein
MNDIILKYNERPKTILRNTIIITLILSLLA